MIISEKNRAKIVRKAGNLLSRFVIFAFLLGLAYVIIYPFIFEILAAFMSEGDLYNNLVSIVPSEWSLDNFKYVLFETEYFKALGNTLLYAVTVAVLTTASAAFVGYGIARFKFRGVKLLTVLMIVIMLVPLQTLSIPIYLNFYSFDPLKIMSLFGKTGPNLLGTIVPLIIMSATCFGFRAGIFVILMRQYYIGVPNELFEAAQVDGAGTFRTFFSIIVPMAKSMIVVILSLSFAWQWTDTFYSNLLYGDKVMLPNLLSLMRSISHTDPNYYLKYVWATAFSLLAILPLIIFYCIMQKRIIQGIERSGLVG